jgi:hypothetical protein
MKKMNGSTFNVSLDYRHPNGNIPNYIQFCFNQTTDAFPFFTLNKRGINERVSNVQLLEYLSDANLKHNPLLSQFRKISESVIFDWCIRGSDFDSYFSASHPWIKSQQYSSHIKYQNKLLKIGFHFELQNQKENNLLRCKVRCDEWPEEISHVNVYQGLYINELQQECYAGGHLKTQKQFCLSLHSIVSADVLLNKVKKVKTENSNNSNSNSNSNQESQNQSQSPEFNLKLLLRFYGARK